MRERIFETNEFGRDVDVGRSVRHLNRPVMEPFDVCAIFGRNFSKHCKSISPGGSVDPSPLNWRPIMDGKVVVVTGASGALGKVVAEAALARGA